MDRESALSLISAGASLITVVLLQLLLPADVWESGTGEELQSISFPARLLLASIVAPLLETLPGQLPPIEILRATSARVQWQIAFNAVAWPGLHVLAGAGPAQAIIMLEVDAVLATGYALTRNVGVARAYTLKALTHAAHNALMITFFSRACSLAAISWFRPKPRVRMRPEHPML